MGGGPRAGVPGLPWVGLALGSEGGGTALAHTHGSTHVEELAEDAALRRVGSAKAWGGKAEGVARGPPPLPPSRCPHISTPVPELPDVGKAL